MSIRVTIQETPNPNARRFLLDKPVQAESRGRFFTGADADDPLARALLEVQSVTAVMLLPTSVTVTKADGDDWQEVQPAVEKALETYFA